MMTDEEWEAQKKSANEQEAKAKEQRNEELSKERVVRRGMKQAAVEMLAAKGIATLGGFILFFGCGLSLLLVVIGIILIALSIQNGLLVLLCGISLGVITAVLVGLDFIASYYLYTR